MRSATCSSGGAETGRGDPVAHVGRGREAQHRGKPEPEERDALGQPEPHPGDAVDRAQEDQRREAHDECTQDADGEEDGEGDSDRGEHASHQRTHRGPRSEHAGERLGPAHHQHRCQHEPCDPEGLAQEPAPEPPEREEDEKQ
jgi:hypothetical protein